MALRPDMALSKSHGSFEQLQDRRLEPTIEGLVLEAEKAELASLDLRQVPLIRVVGLKPPLSIESRNAGL